MGARRPCHAQVGERVTTMTEHERIDAMIAWLEPIVDEGLHEAKRANIGREYMGTMIGALASLYAVRWAQFMGGRRSGKP